MDVDSRPSDPMRRFLMLPVVALALALATPVTGLGQSRTTSAVRGFVMGSDSTPLVGATVTVRHSETGATRTGVTNQRGAFLVLLLQPGGPYTVTVEHLGFATGQVDDLLLQVGEAQTVEVLMREQAVELAGIDVAVDRATIFNPKQVGPATRLTERTLESTPILSRDSHGAGRPVPAREEDRARRACTRWAKRYPTSSRARTGASAMATGS